MDDNKQRDEIILETLDECINDSPKWGICPTVFRTLKSEVQSIMEERDRLEKCVEKAKRTANECQSSICELIRKNESLVSQNNALIAIEAAVSEFYSHEPRKVNIMLDDGAIEPTRAHEYDAGLDLYAREDFTVPAHGSAIHDTGVHIEIPKGYAGILESKSGLNHKHDITGTGTIDCCYTGSVAVKLYNHGNYDYEFKRGNKIIQLVLKKIAIPRVKVVKSFVETERGNNGFGSTGK